MRIKFLTLAPLVLFLPMPLFARSHVVDNAGLLSGGETATLENLMTQIALSCNFDLVIVTEKNIDGANPMAYADDFFDYNGYGLGEDRDGCLFLLVTESRYYWFSTSGRGIRVLNSGAFNKLESAVVGYLRDNDPAGACRAFIGNWEEFLALDAKGRNYNFFYAWNIVLVIIAWVLALLIAFIIVSVWKRQMNTALPRKEADAYVIPGSLAFTQQQDSFLYSTVTRTAKPKTSSSFSGGGGRGSHTSSSGRSHGGGGGKY